MKNDTKNLGEATTEKQSKKMLKNDAENKLGKDAESALQILKQVQKKSENFIEKIARKSFFFYKTCYVAGSRSKSRSKFKYQNQILKDKGNSKKTPSKVEFYNIALEYSKVSYDASRYSKMP